MARLDRGAAPFLALGSSFLALGSSFFVLGVAGRKAFMGVGVAFLTLSIVCMIAGAVRARRAR